MECYRERLAAVAVVKWIQTVIEDYRSPEDYRAFRSYLESRLREKLRRIEELLA